MHILQENDEMYNNITTIIIIIPRESFFHMCVFAYKELQNIVHDRRRRMLAFYFIQVVIVVVQSCCFLFNFLCVESCVYVGKHQERYLQGSKCAAARERKKMHNYLWVGKNKSAPFSFHIHDDDFVAYQRRCG